MNNKNTEIDPHEFDIDPIDIDNPDAEIGEKGGKKFDPKIAIFFVFILLIMGVLYAVMFSGSSAPKTEKQDAGKTNKLAPLKEEPKLTFVEQKPPPAPDVGIDLIKKRLLEFSDKDALVLKTAEDAKYQQQSNALIRKNYSGSVNDVMPATGNAISQDEVSQNLIKRRSLNSGAVTTLVGGQLLGQGGDGTASHASLDTMPARPTAVKGYTPAMSDPVNDSVMTRTSPKRDPANSPPASTGGTSAGASSRSTNVSDQAGKVRSEPYHTTSLARNIPMNPSFFVPQGTQIRCVMQTVIVSDIDGPTTCIVPDAIRSFDGLNVLIPKGSQVIGEYKKADSKTDRVPIIWVRLITPDNIDISLDSPGAGSLGNIGMPAIVDNRWGERLFTAALISLGLDAFAWKVVDKLPTKQKTTYLNGAIEKEAIPFDSQALKVGKSVTETELKRVADISPRLAILQGTIGSIFVAKDLDFSGVYPNRNGAR
jgi:type IV secretory pathway VirB10-like protein